MVIHVKDAEVDALVRALARSRGVSITAAIREAVAEAMAADKASLSREDRLPLNERLKPLLERLDRLPRSSEQTDKKFFDEAWGEAD
jgi:antitoxin VapB